MAGRRAAQPVLRVRARTDRRRPRSAPGPSATTGTISLLVLGALVGGVIAGLVCLVAEPGPRWKAAAGTLAGVVVAGALTAGHAMTVLQETVPEEFDADRRVLAGLCLVVAVAATVGWSFGAAAALGRPGTGLALAVLAGALPLWLSYLLVRFDTLAQGASGEALRWIGVALLAAALAVVGSRPPSRLLWWPVVLAVAWLTGPVLTAAGYLEQLLGPGRGLDAARVVDALAATIDVFFAAASFAVRPVLPWLIAVAAGLCLAELSHRRAAA